MKFEIDDQEYEMGGSMFPLSDMDKVQVYSHENTEPFSNSEFEKIVDFNKFEVGHCYTNSEMIKQIADKFELSVEYYAGWLFFQQPVPIHHAWCVIDGKHLIDMGFSERDIRFMKKIAGDPNWRERYADNVVYRRANIRPSKDCIMGQVPEGVLYVGSPDDMESARTRFRRAMKQYPKHISYLHKGQNPTGASHIQKMVQQLEGKRF